MIQIELALFLVILVLFAVGSFTMSHLTPTCHPADDDEPTAHYINDCEHEETETVDADETSTGWSGVVCLGCGEDLTKHGRWGL